MINHRIAMTNGIVHWIHHHKLVIIEWCNHTIQCLARSGMFPITVFIVFNLLKHRERNNVLNIDVVCSSYLVYMDIPNNYMNPQSCHGINNYSREHIQNRYYKLFGAVSMAQTPLIKNDWWHEIPLRLGDSPALGGPCRGIQLSFWRVWADRPCTGLETLVSLSFALTIKHRQLASN